MRDYGIQFNSDNSATFSGSIGRVNEINAVRLVITLNEELADEAVNCYMLCFDTSAGLENPIKICRRSDIIDGSGSDYYEDGVIYFTVPGELTANKKLGLQVEAHVLDAMGEIERLIKSQVITLELDGSVEGDDSFSEEAADGIVLRIYDAIADANSAAAALSQAQLDGEFNGADGASAYEVAVSNGYTGTAAEWLASLVGSPIPVVTALPSNPAENDLCILKSTATHTPIENVPIGTNRLWINPEFPHDLADYPNGFEVNFYSGTELISGIGAFTSVVAGLDTNTIIGFGNDGDEITWDGDSAPTYKDSNGTVHMQIPAYIELPEFTSCVVTSGTDYAGFDEQHLLYPKSFYKYELYCYNNGWIKATADSADIDVNNVHAHSNKNTLDKLYCETDESTGVISGSTASGYLAHNNGYLRYCTDGAVINGVTTITRDGTTYLRLAFNKEPITISDVPDYVDIPISTVTNVEETNASGITTNATEIDFGVGDAVTNEHTHTNKTVLDGISEATNGTVTILKSGNRAVCELPTYIFGASTHNGVIYAGINTFSSTALTTLTITSFSNPFLFLNPEYNFTFISGSTAATLNLPAAVVWGGGNELVVEANKRYEISIRENVALWTSTDVEVS